MTCLSSEVEDCCATAASAAFCAAERRPRPRPFAGVAAATSCFSPGFSVASGDGDGGALALWTIHFGRPPPCFYKKE